jgi:hypothetical protein
MIAPIVSWQSCMVLRINVGSLVGGHGYWAVR